MNSVKVYFFFIIIILLMVIQHGGDDVSCKRSIRETGEITVIPTLSLWIKHLFYGQEIDLEHWVLLNVKKHVNQ